MRAFSSLMLALYLAFLGLVFPFNSSARRMGTQNVGAQIFAENLTVDLALENLGERYEIIRSNEPYGSRSVLQLTLKVGIRLQNISAEHVVLLDPSCGVVKKSVLREPLVGPIGESGDILAEPQIPQMSPFGGCELGPHPKVVKLMPGKSYEFTEELKFKVIDSLAVDLSESINPGVYYLQFTIELTRIWEMNKQVLPTFPLYVSRMDTALMKFTVKGKPRRKQT